MCEIATGYGSAVAVQWYRVMALYVGHWVKSRVTSGQFRSARWWRTSAQPRHILGRSACWRHQIEAVTIFMTTRHRFRFHELTSVTLIHDDQEAKNHVARSCNLKAWTRVEGILELGEINEYKRGFIPSVSSPCSSSTSQQRQEFKYKRNTS